MSIQPHSCIQTNPPTSYLPPKLFSRVVKLAFPVALQSALVAILALADVLMVSDFGQTATAAVGIASRWHFVAIMIMAALATATGTLVSQYWGRDDRETAKTVTMQSLKFGSIIMIPVTILMVGFGSQIMRLQTDDMQVIQQGADYLLYSLPLLMLTHWVITAEASLRSSGNAVLPLILAAITIAINIGLNFWLIHGGFGVPAMGVAGAALSTTIARVIQVLLIYGVLKFQQHWLIISDYQKQNSRLWQSYKRLAIPNACNAVLWAFGTLTYQMIYGHMGTTELAVYSMIGPFEGLCYAIFMGISVACSVLLGQSLGRDEYLQAQAMSKFFIKCILVMGVVACVIMLLQRHNVITFLDLDSPNFSGIADPAFVVMSFAIIIRMLNMLIINGILRAGGENHFCLRMDFIAMWMVGIPLTAYGAFVAELSFAWVYLLMISEEIVKLSLCFTRYLKRKWLNNLTIQTI
ncbi:MATE family efflux transporter [Vibrio litoralis]|uniref:MATE family efflux transporter n=1 Tax=Vibrio litoralis TaxID=335972 RepID=UPI00041A795F|nr:MATE family efflux transporter [Vibrio litoralis]